MIYPISTLEAIFRLEDIEGLLAAGCPGDEYDSEASMVQVELEILEDKEMSHARVADIISKVWQQTFGPFDEEDWRKRQPTLQSLVQRIMDQGPITAKSRTGQQPPHGNGLNLRRSRL